MHLKQEEIIRDIVIYFDEEGECYVAESELWSANIGCGDTPDEARSEFIDLLEMQWPDYEAGKHAQNRKVGRPAKGKVSFNTRIDPGFKEELEQIATILKCSKGEVIESLIRQFGDKLTRRDGQEI